MEYRSPLVGYYDSSSSYMPRTSRSIQEGESGRRFHPYSNHRGPYGSNPSYGGPGSSTNRPKYSDQFKRPSLPKELRDLYGADECKLCNVELSSPIVGKMHYGGKPHKKKEKKFLLEYSEKTGCQVPYIEESSSLGSVDIASSLPDYCEICDVRSPSVNDKLLHYSGKMHKKNENDPANAKKKKKSFETIDISGRFGIGASFASIDPEKEAKLNITFDEFICDICDVKAVSQDQLQQHLSGKKHKEKLEKKENREQSPDLQKPEKPFPCQICDVSLETRYLFKLHCDGKRHKKNIAKLQLQGDDCCEICNVTFTSPDQAQAHYQGKKHEKRCQQAYKTTVNIQNEKPSLACKLCPYVGNVDNHVCDQSLTKMELYTDLEEKNVCFICYNMVFDTKEELAEHKKSRRHLLCLFNQESGDQIIEELKHWYCFICMKQYRNHKSYTEHLFDLKHMTLSSQETDIVSKTDLFQCTVCNVVMDKEAKDEHLKDIKHLQVALRKDTIKILTELANEDIPTSSFECTHCDLVLNSFVKYSEHLLSLSHMDCVIQMKRDQN